MSETAAYVLLFLLVAGILLPCSLSAQEPVKQAPSLFPPEVVQRLRDNTAKIPWMAEEKANILDAAKPWMARSDDELWELMFGATISRSWMVWSNGHCPACGKGVPMYNWKMAALDRPWKVWCPHCQEAFPKNDFVAFYKSGLDEHGVFDPARADRSLLFNVEHPDPNDPKHLLGVDDGEGYVEGENRWRFIGAYLVYGQWKQAIVAGINTLSAAYVLTGEPAYAHKAGILLDRVADLYPSFDFGTQAYVYEVKAAAGYVSTWHDACEETREIVMAYDMIFEGIRSDAELAAFLSAKAQQYKLENPKASFADIQRNIEGRILRDALSNRAKIKTNYPRTEIAEAIILTVLGKEQNEAAFWGVVDAMMDKATSVDGVTGEKGLAGYAAYTIQSVAMFLAEFSKADPAFLAKILEKHPRLRESFRFHIDTHCLNRYYPLSGDTGAFAAPVERYVGMPFIQPGFSKSGSISWSMLPPSTYTLLWRLYELTGDAAYVQTLYRANGYRGDNLPMDLYLDNPEAIRTNIENVIKREGTLIPLKSVNKTQWCLGILRSGEPSQARALWLDYDSGGGHGHADGMNLGLFAKGLDLAPDFGYPPVQYGGWNSRRAVWYTKTSAHNTVVVDGRNLAAGSGETTLWADGSQFHAIRASAPAMNGGQRYERTLLLVDVSPSSFYVVDVFRVAGGKEHVKFFQSHFGTVTPAGLNLQPAPDLDTAWNDRATEMRNFRMDADPQVPWSADWEVEDRIKLLPEGHAPVRVRYTDLTSGAQAGLADAWVSTSGYGAIEETWVPRVFVQRKAEGEAAALESVFVSMIEPYETEPALKHIERIPITSHEGADLGENHVALQLTLADGRRDIVILRDPTSYDLKEVVAGGVVTDADTCLVRVSADDSADGSVEFGALCRGTVVSRGTFHAELGSLQQFAELHCGGLTR